MRLLCVLLLLCSGKVFAQEIRISENTTDIQAIFDSNCLKDTKFENAKKWIAKSFGDYQKVVQYEDKEKSSIIIKGMFPLKGEHTFGDMTRSSEKPFLSFTLSLDFKDDRHRIKFEGLLVKVDTEVGIFDDTDYISVVYSIKDYCNRIVSGQTTLVDINGYEQELEKEKMRLDSLSSMDISNIKNKERKKIEDEISSLKISIEKRERKIASHYYWTDKPHRSLKNIEDVINSYINSLNTFICDLDEW